MQMGILTEMIDSFGSKSVDKAPKMSESTRIMEAYFTEFAERVQALQSSMPTQLSGGFHSRTGMADAIDSGVCSLIGLGRSAVLQPDLPKAVILNPSIPDEEAFAVSHIVKGHWFANAIPVKVVGAGLAIQFFYHNMRRLGNGKLPMAEQDGKDRLIVSWSHSKGLRPPMLAFRREILNIHVGFVSVIVRLVGPSTSQVLISPDLHLSSHPVFCIA